MGADQVIDEAQARGLALDSIRLWRAESALRDAFSHPFVRKGPGSADNLRALALEFARQAPEDSVVALLNGMASLQSRNWSECRRVLDPARRKWPESVRMRGMRGMCLFAQGMPDSALSEIPDFRKMSTESPWARGRHIWMTKTFLDWTGAAEIASRGQGARQFRRNLRVCRMPVNGEWRRASDEYCQIQAWIQPGDTARLCQDAGDPEVLEFASPSMFGKRSEDVIMCPEWAMVRPGVSSVDKLTDCVFGGSDSGSTADCPQ